MPAESGGGAALPEETPPSPFRRWWSRRVAVQDDSMLPTLRPGDRLLVDPRAYRTHPPRAGEIVILVDPEDAARWLVKRVVDVQPQTRTVEVRGDAAEVARDSRQFGAVSLDAIVGRAYRCYYPPERRQEL